MTSPLNIIDLERNLPEDFSLDNPERLKMNASLWQRIVHFPERRWLNNTLYQNVLKLFSERYGFKTERPNDKKIFERMWNKIAAQEWSPSQELTAGKLRAIDARFKRELVYHGKGITPPAERANTDHRIHKIIQILLHGGKLNHQLVSAETARAVFVKHDPVLVGDFKNEFQHELQNLAAHLPTDPAKEIVWRTFLGNILALLPFCYPETGTIFSIPVLTDGVCRMVDYRVEVINLPYTSIKSPLTALGMTPVEDPDAVPILSFIGTTFPAGTGFGDTVLADFTPGHSVGEAVYKRNKNVINDWFAGKNNVHTVGMSLGGAMVFHTLRDQHEKIGRVDAYNPPGLYPGAWDDRQLSKSCAVNIYCQPGDIVSELGVWPTGDNVSLYRVYAHQKGVTESTVSSHPRAFTGCKKTTIVKEDPKKENASFFRRFVTALHMWVAPIFVFIPLSIGILIYRGAEKVHHFAVALFKKRQKRKPPS